MKKLMKAMTLLLAVMMLLASCEQTTPEPPAVPDAPAVPDVPAVPDTPEKPDTPPTPADKMSFLPAEPDTAIVLPSDLEPYRGTAEDPEHPHDQIHHGLFHDQVINLTASPLHGVTSVPCDVTVRYSLYIPSNGYPKTPAVLVLTPDNFTAEEFAETPTGQKWLSTASEKVFAVAFVEPADGKTWNIDPASYTSAEPAAKGGRDERIALFQVVQAIRSKTLTEERAYISADKNSFGVVGYGEGATAATIAAAAWPQVFANIVAVNPVNFPADTVRGLLEMDTFRHNDEYEKAAAEHPLPSKVIPMPMYVVKGEDEASADAIVSIWKDVNEHALREDSSAEEKYYVSELVEDGTVSSVSSLAIMNVRPRGYAGGTLRTRTDMWHTPGFEINDAAICADKGNDEIRRWAIYTPVGLDETSPVPMVTVLHGSSASITDIVDESKWAKVADENGIIILFCQAGPDRNKDNRQTGWRAWGGGVEDIDFILAAVKDVQAKHNIDASRIYITGHSLGSMMINALLKNADACKVFAAYAPVGSACSANANTPDVELAVYNILGEWEFRNTQAGPTWAARFGIEGTPDPVFLEGYTPEKYQTWTWVDENGHEPVKVTKVMDSPHVYMAEESEIIWDWFKGISRNTETLELVFAD